MRNICKEGSRKRNLHAKRATMKKNLKHQAAMNRTIYARNRHKGNVHAKQKAIMKGHHPQNKSVHKGEIASKPSREKGTAHEKCIHGRNNLQRSLSEGKISAKVPIKRKI